MCMRADEQESRDSGFAGRAATVLRRVAIVLKLRFRIMRRLGVVMTE